MVMDRSHSVRVTSDPATAKCRIWVGGISGDIHRTDLESHFEKYGTVIGKLKALGVARVRMIQIWLNAEGANL